METITLCDLVICALLCVSAISHETTDIKQSKPKAETTTPGNSLSRFIQLLSNLYGHRYRPTTNHKDNGTSSTPAYEVDTKSSAQAITDKLYVTTDTIKVQPTSPGPSSNVQSINSTSVAQMNETHFTERLNDVLSNSSESDNSTTHPTKTTKTESSTTTVAPSTTPDPHQTHERHKEKNRPRRIDRRRNNRRDFHNKKKSSLTKDNGDKGKKHCPNCDDGPLSEDEIRQLKIDQFKMLMAEKLAINLEELNVKAEGPKIPNEIFAENMRDNARIEREEDFYGQDKEVLIPATELKNCQRKHATGCFSFDLRGKLRSGIASATLWFRKMRDRNDRHGVTFVVYGLGLRGRTYRNERLIATSFMRQPTEEWVKIDVKYVVYRWLKTMKRHGNIAIHCKDCITRSDKVLFGAKGGYTPILELEYDRHRLPSRRPRRQKRSTEDDENEDEDGCVPGLNNCCRRSLRINFSSMGMSTIRGPPSMDIGYCYGNCVDDLPPFRFNHTIFRMRHYYTSRTLSRTDRQNMAPCCVPQTTKAHNVIALIDGVFRRPLIPGIIVKTCECI